MRSMPSFGKKSREALDSCHPDLIRLMETVILQRDCVILEGHRGEETQNADFAAGRSKLQYPNGKHNAIPSNALDAVPYPIIWPDKESRPNTYREDWMRLANFIGFVQGVATQLGIKIRVGLDWNDNDDYTDDKFQDGPHIELVDH